MIYATASAVFYFGSAPWDVLKYHGTRGFIKGPIDGLCYMANVPNDFGNYSAVKKRCKVVSVLLRDEVT